MTQTVDSTEVTERTVEGRGFTSHALIAGDPGKPAVILLHGAGPGANASANWRHLMPDLAENFYVVAPDLIGFGQSVIPEPPPSNIVAWMGVRVEQVLGILDELEIAEARLVGNSMGGGLTLQLLSEASGRFGPCVLMGSIGGPMPRTPEFARLLTFYSDPRQARYREIMHSFAYDADEFEGMEDIVQSRFKIATDPKVMATAPKMIESMNTGLDSLVMPPSVLNKIPNEILIFHGRQDRIVPLDPSLYLLQHLQRVSLFVIDRSGHWAQLERWDIMRPLLERHFGAKSWN